MIDLSAIDFPVELRPAGFMTPAGWKEIENKRAVVRTDTETAFSMVSDQYQLIPHRRVLEPMLGACGELELVPVVREGGRRSGPLRIEGDGRRVHVELRYPRGGIEVPGHKDMIEPRVVLGNSYDKSSAVYGAFGFYQVKCTNAGAVMKGGLIRGTGGAGGFRFAHTSDEYENINEALNSVKAFLSGFPQRITGLLDLAGGRLDEARAKQIYLEMVGARQYGKSPLESKDLQDGWTLYSKITNWLTMDFKGGQQPMEKRAGEALALILKEIRGDVPSA